MGKRGPPTDLSPQKIDKVCEAVAKGNHYRVAAALVGVHPSTLSNWLAKGERAEPGSIYKELLDRMMLAEAQHEARLVDVMVAEAEVNPKFALAYSGRRFAERWGRHDNVTISQVDDERVDAQSAKDKLAEKFTELVRALRDTASVTADPEP
jgi:transposase